MARARKPKPTEKPSSLDQLRDFLWEVRAALTSLAILVIVGSIAASLNLPSVTGECPGGGIQPRVVAMLRGPMAEECRNLGDRLSTGARPVPR